MSRYASGKHSLRISDRSGAAFPYKEMVREWNGSIVHTSEFEPKHPQLIQTKKQLADPEALRIAKGQISDATAFPPIDGINFSSFQSEGMQPASISNDTKVGTALGSVVIGPTGSVQIFTMTVAAKAGGGGNAYYADGQQQRAFQFQVGQVRAFSFSDNSSNGHPMLLSTTSDGSHSGGSIYTTNVAYRLAGSTFVDQASYIAAFTSPSQTRELILTIDSSTPTLYYYCPNHPGMGGSITII